MNFGKRALLLLFSSITCVNAYAQYTDDEGGIETENGYLRYFEFGAGATYQNLLDEAVSPILYAKIGAMPMVGYTKVSSNTLSDVVISASSLKLGHNRNKTDKPKVKMQRAMLDYRFLIDVPFESRSMDAKAGLALSAMFNYKNAPHLLDAAEIYEYVASIGLSGRVTKEMDFRRKTVLLYWDLTIPFFANLSRPYYLNRQENEDPDNKVIKDFFSNSSSGSIGKFFRLNSKLGAMYRLENGNIVKVGYQWDYYRIKTINTVRFADHSLFVSFMFNF